MMFELLSGNNWSLPFLCIGWIMRKVWFLKFCFLKVFEDFLANSLLKRVCRKANVLGKNYVKENIEAWRHVWFFYELNIRRKDILLSKVQIDKFKVSLIISLNFTIWLVIYLKAHKCKFYNPNRYFTLPCHKFRNKGNLFEKELLFYQLLYYFQIFLILIKKNWCLIWYKVKWIIDHLSYRILRVGQIQKIQNYFGWKKQVQLKMYHWAPIACR